MEGGKGNGMKHCWIEREEEEVVLASVVVEEGEEGEDSAGRCCSPRARTCSSGESGNHPRRYLDQRERPHVSGCRCPQQHLASALPPILGILPCPPSLKMKGQRSTVEEFGRD